MEISQMSERHLTRIRNQKIGFVFQFYNLLPALTALENIALPVYFSKNRAEVPKKRAQDLLSQLELSDREDHQPAQLSGGQQQRIAIARALANRPPILLADEPTGNLNTETGEMVLESIFDLRESLGTTIVIVTHNTSIAARTDRILKLVDGVIVS
jgi:lipoprotein-releasing system ATP-binding protein